MFVHILEILKIKLNNITLFGAFEATFDLCAVFCARLIQGHVIIIQGAQ